MRRYCRSPDYVNYTYRFDLDLMSNVQSIKVVLQHNMYMYTVGVRFYNMIVLILLILKPIFYITNILNRLVAVQHTIISRLYILYSHKYVSPPMYTTQASTLRINKPPLRNKLQTVILTINIYID